MKEIGFYKDNLIVIEEHVEEDNRKLEHCYYPPGTWAINGHNIQTIPGEAIHIDLSPYEKNGMVLCAIMIELGNPSREDVGMRGSFDQKRVFALWLDKSNGAASPSPNYPYKGKALT